MISLPVFGLIGSTHCIPKAIVVNTSLRAMEGPSVKRSIDAYHVALLPSEHQTNVCQQKAPLAVARRPTTKLQRPP